MMEAVHFSKTYTVRKLQKDNVEKIYELCKENALYYQYCPPFVTRESIEEDMIALPAEVTKEHKYYVGFFDGERLIAVLDLIDGYPQKDIVFIGFFMCDVCIQNSGIGTAMIGELIEYIRSLGYQAVRLAWVKGNPQAEHFWLKNSFTPIKETSSTAADCVILAERRLE